MKSLLYIGNKLSVHGLSVTTIETLGPLLESEGYSVKYASSKKNKLFRLLEMLKVTFQLRNKVDYILIDTYSTSNFWYAFFVSQLARIFGTKYIPILHGGNLRNRLKKSKWFSKQIFKNSYKNVSPSQYLLEAFISNGFSNTIYIPNTIQIENYQFKLRSKVAPKLLWVRSFAKIYNPKMAVEVFKIVKEKFPEATLCMIGPDKDGSLATTIELAKQYNLDIEFTGKLSKEEWILRATEYDIFINTTHFDNMPVSIIEAMALGLLVVSTNVGGLNYLLEDKKDAFLVNDNDYISMAETILFLCKNPDLSLKSSQFAREKAIGFDWNFVKNKWNETII